MRCVCHLLTCPFLICAVTAVMRLVAYLPLSLPGVFTVWNIENRFSCGPAAYNSEGSCFCTNQVYVWDINGFLTCIDLDSWKEVAALPNETTAAPVNAKTVRQCAAGSTKCLDYRCPDDVGEKRYNRTTTRPRKNRSASKLAPIHYWMSDCMTIAF